MKTFNKIYEELRKRFTDEEIVEGYVFPDDMTQHEIDKIQEEFKKIRLALLKQRTEEQRLLSEVMRMKLLIQDYLKNGKFDEQFSFANQLREYIKIIDRSKKDFAAEIDIHPTRLSRMLNDKESPNVELTYRLEKHCGNVIPAIYWWKLFSKKLEQDIKNDEETRRIESNRVKNNLQFV
jgi:plasmid maintenance system antidote protein VapI